jgi:hypothetical protein
MATSEHQQATVLQKEIEVDLEIRHTQTVLAEWKKGRREPGDV